MTKRFWPECIGGCGRIHDDCEQTHDDCEQTHDDCRQIKHRQDLPILMITAELNANRLA